MRRATKALWTTLPLAACTWISDEQLAQRQDLDQDGISWLDDCDDGDGAHATPVLRYRDDDGDGYGDPTTARSFCKVPEDPAWVDDSSDCDDDEAFVHPNAAEVCNNRDDDCDERVDDDDDDLDATTASLWFPDDDDDGVPAQALGEARIACLAPSPSWALAPEDDLWDCDDDEPGAFPGNTETCDDQIDNDCDGETDDKGEGETAWYVDADNDGYPVDTEPQYLCRAEVGYVPASDDLALDCDDADERIHPGAVEVWYDGVDQDCDEADDYDQDGDGHTPPSVGVGSADDCNDLDPNTYTGAPEVWYDGIDQACDGGNDYDRDGDGWASSEHDVPRNTDCDDGDAAIRPDADELWYDGVDQDCDGADDFDQDGDGHQVDLHGGPDCDDTDPNVLPGATETWYDGVDQDCDGADDYDRDGDGHSPTFVSVGTADDCDDDEPTVHGGADEVWYDGVDQACDGGNDYDQDGDGFASADFAVPLNTDCDDTDEAVHPSAVEVWYDGVDSSCHGRSDYDQDADGVEAEPRGPDCDDTDSDVLPGVDEQWYDGIDQNCDDKDDYDQDEDGFQASLIGGEDCNDTDADVRPDADEWCYDLLDNDCDGITDDRGANGSAYWPDRDFDGYSTSVPDQLCHPLPGYLANPTAEDCDDTRATVNPGAVEIWYDGVDQDCDRGDDYDQDGDGDGAATLSPSGSDCDDRDPTRSSLQVEWCDDIDWNCDGDPLPSDGGLTAVGTDGSRAALANPSTLDATGLAELNVCGGDWTLSLTTAHDDGVLRIRGLSPAILRPRGGSLLATTSTPSGTPEVWIEGLSLAPDPLAIGAGPWMKIGEGYAIELRDVAISSASAQVLQAIGSEAYLTDVTFEGSTHGLSDIDCVDCTLSLDRVDVSRGTYGDGAVRASGAADVEFTAVHAAENTGLVASVLHLSGGAQGRMERSSADMNSGTLGGVVYLADAALTVEASTFTENDAHLGGVIAVEDGDLLLRDLSFVDNTAVSGGALYLSPGDGEIFGGYAQGNAASNGGFAYVSGGFVLVEDVVATDHVASVDGGVLYLDDSVAVITGTTMARNAASADGGAVFATGDAASITFVDSTVSANRADDGGAVALAYSASSFAAGVCDFDSNVATGRGGAFYLGKNTLFVGTGVGWHANVPDDVNGTTFNVLDPPDEVFCRDGLVGGCIVLSDTP